MGMLEDFMELLIDRGHDVSDMVRGPFVDALDGAPDADSQTALILSPSSQPPLSYCGALYDVHRLAVQIRRLDPVECRAVAQALYADLFGIQDATAGDSRFLEVIPQTTPYWIDEDEHHRTVYGFNVEVRRRDAGS